MLNTLYARLAAVLVVIFLAIGISYAFVTSTMVEHYLQELSQHFNRDLAKRIVADRNLVEEGRMNEQALKSTFSAYMDINPSIEIYLLDLEGNILSFSADPGKVKRKHVDLGPIQAFLREEGYPILGDDPRSHDRMKAFSVTPVPSADDPAGYLYVVLQGEQYESAEQLILESYALKLSVWAIAGSLGFGLIAGLLLFYHLTRRLQRLSRVMERFQESRFTHHEAHVLKPSGRPDEIERLGVTFDQMAEHILAQLKELKDQDQLRRELVAQVSHDLRTPLAVLHGYLETMRMKEGEQDEVTRQEHLEITLRQSTHLKRMVEELFELAHLEARDTQPRLEPCAMGELLSDMQQKFRLRAEQAGITLQLDPPGSIPMAMADIALTERVLDNLIGNAIEHTHDGGMVRLALEAGDRWVTVTVTDSGGGIPADDIPHLFEPFYRGGQKGGDKRHAGLGLAIAKRIVDLQGGEIWAGNIDNGGACFGFTLTRA
ncbi:MAG: HAMP domain-containing sensor histidine kinase [Candidatus Sedimenticola sp. PURPLELP]